MVTSKSRMVDILAKDDRAEESARWHDYGRKWGQMNAAFWVGQGGAFDGLADLDDLRGSLEAGYAQGLRLGEERDRKAEEWVRQREEREQAAQQDRMGRSRQAIYIYLLDHGPAWPKAISEATGLKHEVAQMRALAMVRDGVLEGGPEGFSVHWAV